MIQPKPNYRGGDIEMAPPSSRRDPERHHDNSDNDDADDELLLSDVEDEMQVQRYAIMAKTIALIQVSVLLVQLIQCGAAPLSVNPMLGPWPDVLNYWGAKNVALIVGEDEYYRFITPMFLHGGLLHILGNVYIQLLEGTTIERVWGTPIWLIVYFVGGVYSTLLSCKISPETLGVGSSGAVMALLGGFLTFNLYILTFGEDPRRKFLDGNDNIYDGSNPDRQLLMRRGTVIVRKEQAVNMLIIVSLVMLMSFVPLVDWSAHLGGLVSGSLLVLLIFPSIALVNRRIRSLMSFLLHVSLVGGSLVTLLVVFATQLADVLGFTEEDWGDQLGDICENNRQYAESIDYEYECECRPWGGGDDER